VLGAEQIIYETRSSFLLIKSDDAGRRNLIWWCRPLWCCSYARFAGWTFVRLRSHGFPPQQTKTGFAGDPGYAVGYLLLHASRARPDPV